MDITTLVIIIVAVVVVLALIGAAVAWTRRSVRLKKQFGPEYERAVDEKGRYKGESELRDREKRHKGLELRPLSAETAEGYRVDWDKIQHRFVDEPGTAVDDADRLVVRIMRDRGYPVEDFDQRADDISVEHPDVAQYYREAHGVAIAHQRGRADTEQMRESVRSYRSLVNALLDDTGGGNAQRS